MRFKLEYTLNDGLPKLGWLASWNRDSDTIDVIHGKAVECRDEWMVEGVWDGDFAGGDFHRSAFFFGSGIRLEEERVYIIPSSGLVDRILYCEDGATLYFSNSLILMLAKTGARLDDTHDYRRESLSFLDGIDCYDKHFRIVHPTIDWFYQVFYENIVLTVQGIEFRLKDYQGKEINTFEQYYSLLTKTLERIKHNSDSRSRKNKMAAFTTISSGYDSAAVSALVRDVGVDTCFTGNPVEAPWPIVKLKQLLPFLVQKRYDDCNLDLAKKLTFDVCLLDRRRESISKNELFFLAATYPKPSEYPWSEISFHSIASHIEKNCTCSVVFTGYHGDKIWDCNTSGKYLSNQIVRGDFSGLGLTEIRLKAGFINAPVPFFMARNLIDVVTLSNLKEMEPWRLHNNYDRPIPRRILEEKKEIPRDLFGRRKVFIANKYIYPLNPELRKAFFRHMSEHLGIGRFSIILFYTLFWVSAVLTHRHMKSIGKFLKSLAEKLLPQDTDLSYHMVHWATGNLVEQTSKILSNN